MKPTLSYLKSKYEQYNIQIFGGRLPEVPISLCEVTSFVGQYKSKNMILPNGRRETYGSQLRFSTAFDLSERELDDILIHEMIHYFISYNGLHDRSTHGPLFKALMNSINETHGRAITISRRTTQSELAEAKTVQKKWHVVAILRFSTGELGVKVLPRVIQKIVDYHTTMLLAPNVRRIDLYLHNDGFFNRFPTSVGRRCHLITEEEIRVHLAGAHLLEVQNGKLLQR